MEGKTWTSFLAEISLGWPYNSRCIAFRFVGDKCNLQLWEGFYVLVISGLQPSCLLFDLLVEKTGESFRKYNKSSCMSFYLSLPGVDCSCLQQKKDLLYSLVLFAFIKMPLKLQTHEACIWFVPSYLYQ